MPFRQPNRAQHPHEGLAHRALALLLGIGKYVGGRMDPALGPSDWLPQSSGLCQASLNQLLDLGEFGRSTPFSSTRCTLATILLSRSWSRRPGASSGATPSSLSALRTATA